VNSSSARAIHNKAVGGQRIHVLRIEAILLSRHGAIRHSAASGRVRHRVHSGETVP
jgi:hypothetical protein